MRKGAAEQGYYDGQADVLGVLTGDFGLEGLHRELAPEFALWCLAHNLEVAGALKRSDQLAKANANTWNARIGSRIRY